MSCSPELIAALRAENARRLRGEGEGRAHPDAASRLALYGTLVPGGVNHHLMEPYPGSWSTGVVRGTLYAEGWGALVGAPAMVWRPDGEPIEVHLLESEALATGWAALDAFEGPEYARLLVPVETPTDVRVANLYALRAESLRRER